MPDDRPENDGGSTQRLLVMAQVLGVRAQTLLESGCGVEERSGPPIAVEQASALLRAFERIPEAIP